MSNADKKQVKILDGGTATELVRLGVDIDRDPLWSARLLHTNPSVIKQVHKNFLDSGSEVVVTASYQASVDGFCKYAGVTEEKAIELIKLSVKLAREVCNDVTAQSGIPRFVAGSVGPYGAAMHDGSEYNGNYTDTLSKQELIDWQRPRVKALLEAGCDYLAVETIPAQKEAEAVLDLLKEYPHAKAWLTFSCGSEDSTFHGEKLADAIKAVIGSTNLVAVGVNCTSPLLISPLLKSIRYLDLSLPVIVKPNSGEEWESGKGWYGRPETPLLSNYVLEWYNLGASWIGGCCRVFPDDISDMKRILESKT